MLAGCPMWVSPVPQIQQTLDLQTRPHLTKFHLISIESSIVCCENFLTSHHYFSPCSKTFLGHKEKKEELAF